MTDADTATASTRGDSSGAWHSLARAALVFVRVLQVAFTVFGVLFVIGGLGMNVFQFAVLGIVALVLFALVGILELVARGIRGWV